MMKPLGSILLSVALLMGASTVASADNRIQSVIYNEVAGATEIRIKGSEAAAFSVYKLEKPTRIVIDVSSASLLAKEGNTWMTGTWAVSQVTTSPLVEGAGSVRVMVTLARPGKYNVRADGNDIVVSVTAREAMPMVADKAAVTAAQQQAANAVSDAKQRVAAADHEVKRAQNELARVQEESKRATIVASESAAKANAEARKASQDADAARKEADRLRTTLAALEAKQAAQPSTVNQAAVTRAKADADQARLAAERRASEANHAAKSAEASQRAAQALAVQAEANRKLADTALNSAKADAQAARNETATAKRELATARARETAARTAAESARVTAVAAQQDADVAKRAADKWKADAEAAESRAKLAQSQAEADRKLASVANERAKSAEQKVAALEARLATTATPATKTTAFPTHDAVAKKSQVERDQLLADLRAARAETEAKPAPTSTGEPNTFGKTARATNSQRDALAQRTPTPASTPVPMAMNLPGAEPAFATVRDIRFDDSDGATVVVDMKGSIAPRLVASDTRHVEYILPSASLPEALQRKLDVTKFGTGVSAVSAYRDAQSAVRLRVEFKDAIPTFERAGDMLRFRFAPTARAVPPAMVGAYGAAQSTTSSRSASTGGSDTGRKYTGARLDLDYKDAPIHDLLRILADTGRVNIVVPDEIKASVTVSMKQVPWDKALEVILESKDLWYRREGNLYRIAPRKKLDAEDEAEAARRKAAIELETPEPEMLTLNYTSASEAKDKLTSMLSPKGKIEVDERTNSLIVNDILANRRRVQQLALQLDTQTPQISIEARIVEARSQFRREIGVQWGGRASATAAGGNATGLRFPSDIAFGGGADDGNTTNAGIVNGVTDSAVPTNFAVNLPAAVGTGSGGALGLTLGSLNGNYNISLRLSALEQQGTARIISSPSVTVLNNFKAVMRQGVAIPVSTVSANGTNTTFVNADLALEVKPYVSQRDCSIAMDVKVTKNEPDFGNVGSRGDPTLLEKEAQTRILVADGETTVMGGIYTRNTGLSYRKVPIFGDIPVFGWLFKNRQESDDRTELLIFITPKITNKASLRCQ